LQEKNPFLSLSRKESNPRLQKALCRVYTCRFDNQMLNRKLVKKYFIVVKLAQYFVCDENKKLASYCKQEIWVFKLGKLFSQTSGFVLGRQNR